MARTKATVPVHLNAALWKALASIVSTDVTRKTVMHVHVRNDRRTMEATDGHCAIQVMFPADLELAPGLYDPRSTLARVKADVAPEAALPFVHDQWEYPNVDQVMPSRCEGFTERSDIGFNPALVGRVMDAVGDILHAVGATNPGIMLDTSDDLSPALVYGDALGVKVRAAIMPMRVGEPRKRPQKDTFEADSAIVGVKEDLKAATKRAAYLESVVTDLRAEIVRLTADLNDARECADTDAADAMLARQAADELRAELNTLRHLRPKGDVMPVLLSNPIARA